MTDQPEPTRLEFVNRLWAEHELTDEEYDQHTFADGFIAGAKAAHATLTAKLAEAERERDAHPVHEACPACLANRESLRKRADRFQAKLAHAEQENAALRERMAGAEAQGYAIGYRDGLARADADALTQPAPLSANPDTPAERPHVRDTGQGVPRSE